MVKLIDNKENTYSPCKKCKLKLEDYHSGLASSFERNKSYFRKFLKNPKFALGDHGFETAFLKGINMYEKEEKIIAGSGELIDFQLGKNPGEFKFILSTIRNNEPIHYIFLRTPDLSYPCLINVYNPTEGMSFKWSSDGKKRLYLNNFRSCCPHPLDAIENYNKKHHGVNHEKYRYQSNN